MAASPSLTLLLVFTLFLHYLTFTTSTSIPVSSSTVASEQLNFWSKNVRNKMPKLIFKKLSPLSVHDSDLFTSLVATKRPFSSDDANFCSAANLACASNVDINKPLADNGYLIGYISAYSMGKAIVDQYSQLDPLSFFRLSILEEGKSVHLPKLEDRCPPRAFLPSQIASKISLTPSEVKRVFPESFASPLTKEAISMTLLQCNTPSLKGEIKSCPKSLEEMIEFSKNALGQEHLNVLTSKFTKGSAEKFIVGNIKRYDDKKFVSCHEVFFPFVTNFCHLTSSSGLYVVDLLDAETRVPVNTALAICHFDTSAWPANHVSFKILQLSPGKGEICHWYSQNSLAWVAA